MHNDINNISNLVVKKLNKLASRHLSSKFRKVFNNLVPYHKECFRRITTVEGHTSAMLSILNATEKNEAVSTFYNLLRKDQGFAFKTLDSASNALTLFKTLFGRLNRHKKKYIQHAKESLTNPKAMFSILSEMKKNEAVRTFCSLLKKSESFAFKVLDTFAGNQHDLFEILFNKLDHQQKEDYKVHLETKRTAKAKLVLELFYPSDERELRIENFNTDSESLGQRNRSFEDESSMSNDPSSFLNSITLEEIIDQCELDPRNLGPEFTFVEEMHIEQVAEHQYMSLR